MSASGVSSLPVGRPLPPALRLLLALFSAPFPCFDFFSSAPLLSSSALLLCSAGLLLCSSSLLCSSALLPGSALLLCSGPLHSSSALLLCSPPRQTYTHDTLYYTCTHALKLSPHPAPTSVKTLYLSQLTRPTQPPDTSDLHVCLSVCRSDCLSLCLSVSLIYPSLPLCSCSPSGRSTIQSNIIGLYARVGNPLSHSTIAGLFSMVGNYIHDPSLPL